MFVNSRLEWQEWLRNGDQYLKAATPRGKTSRFRPEIQYNLLALSLEGYIMAILGFHNSLPFNHTFTDLLDGLETLIPVDKDLKARILKYENIQSICSIEKYARQQPSRADLADLKDAVTRIGQMAHELCAAPSEAVTA